MPIGPVGSVIYANQMITAQATKQSEIQNALQMQSVVAAAIQNEKEDEVQDVRPPEEAYRIDPEKEHQRQKNEEEQGATEEEYKRDEKERKEEEQKPLHVGLLDIKA
jgi:hypothetical protein